MESLEGQFGVGLDGIMPKEYLVYDKNEYTRSEYDSKINELEVKLNNFLDDIQFNYSFTFPIGEGFINALTQRGLITKIELDQRINDLMVEMENKIKILDDFINDPSLILSERVKNFGLK